MEAGQRRPGFFLDVFRSTVGLCRNCADLVLLSLLAFFIHIPVFPDRIWPQHDTLFTFWTFFAFYNELFVNGDFLRWLPYGAYGIPVDLNQIFNLSPASYLVGCAGWLFRVKNVLLLYKVSVLFEHLMLLVGTYRLGREMFKHRATTFFVCVGVLASTAWIVQIAWNFRIYYLLPWIFYFLVLFFERKKPHFLWFSATVVFVSLIGNPVYYLPLHFFIVSIVCFVLSFNNWNTWSCLFERSFRNLASFLLFLFVALVYLFFVLNILNYAVSYSYGRDPVTQKATIEHFMNFSTQTGTLQNLFLAGFTSLETTWYVGLLPLVFLVYAFAKVRNRWFVMLLTIALFVFSFGVADTSFLARILFEYFPPVRIYRYIGHIGGVMRLCLMLLAGLGMDRYLEDLKESPDTSKGFFRIRGSLLSYGLGVVVFLMLFTVFYKPGASYPVEWSEFFRYGLVLLGVAVLILGGRSSAVRDKMGFVAVVFLLADLLSFQNLLYHSKSWPYQWNWPWADEKVTNVSDHKYQDRRSFAPPADERSQEAYRVLTESQVRQSVEAYGYALFDPCFADIPVLMPKGVHDLIFTRELFGISSNGSVAIRTDQNTQTFFRTVGCEVPKLRLVSDVVFAQDESRALELLKKIPNVDQKIILRGVSDGIRKGWVSAPDFGNLGTVRVESFSSNCLRLTADVTRPGGAWLYYADSYHPGWQAWVNGKVVSIAEANRAFKAVKLQEGKNVVYFRFFNGMISILSIIIALLGLVFGFLLLLPAPCKFLVKS